MASLDNNKWIDYNTYRPVVIIIYKREGIH
jgi:hypothetical protein